MRKSNTIFSNAYEALPCNMQEQVRKEIREANGWADSTFKSKKNGNRNLSDEETEILKTIFAKYGVDYISGTNIFFK